jgi:hypothetical protein
MTVAPPRTAIIECPRSPAPGSALRRLLFGITPDEAHFERRGFAAAVPATQRRLEEVGRTFIAGYGAGLDVERPEELTSALSAVPAELRGFAFEGAAMSLTLLDLVTPWRRDRFARYLGGPADPHAYMTHVGAGWALARLGRSPERVSLPFDPLLRGLVIDGYGFHEGYFHWQRVIVGQRRPSRFAGDAAQIFDQGVGRSLWFVEGGDPDRVARRIGGFAADRRADLWSGIGLAAAYAGGVDERTLGSVRAAAGGHVAALAQGAAFAAKARARAQNPAAHTELACQSFAGRSADDAARITDVALADLSTSGLSSYQAWRRGIQRRLLPSAASLA